ncbi:MAG: copper chaperone PCu(A)C [Salana multivorans]|nr:copper chaperone PCu(A)C [Salana multivorans]
MSAAFGVLENPTDADLAVVGVSSPVSSQMQLHETVVVDGAMKMQQVDSFTVPAGGTFVLEPGGNHLMFMDLTTPVAPGDDVDLTLDLADGSTYSVTVQAREFTGADEEYVGGEMNGMDMHEDDHAEH